MITFKQLLILLMGVSVTTGWSQGTILTEIREILPSEIKVEGFKLNATQTVSIEAVGFRTRRSSSFTRAWILNSATREVVWDMDSADSDKMKRRLVKYQDTISLPRGGYEVYYSSYPSYTWHKEHRDGFFERLFEDFFNDENYEDVYEDYRQEWREFRIIVRSTGERVRETELKKLREGFEAGTFISMTGLRNDEYLRQGFRLEPMTTVGLSMRKAATKSGSLITEIPTMPAVRKRTALCENPCLCQPGSMWLCL